MRVISGRIGSLGNTAACLLVAMGLSMIVRPLTAALNQTVGTVWPFSSVHCVERTSPGCMAEPRYAAARLTLARR